MSCHYDQLTERYLECDGHHRCECETAEMRQESHAVLIAEITRLRTEVQVLRGVLRKAMQVIGEVRP